MPIVIVEFKGSLQTLAKKERCKVEFKEKMMISTLLSQLKEEIFQGREFIDESNILIVLNGKEISVLKGVKTELKVNDIIKLVPISHGG